MVFSFGVFLVIDGVFIGFILWLLMVFSCGVFLVIDGVFLWINLLLLLGVGVFLMCVLVVDGVFLRGISGC